LCGGELPGAGTYVAPSLNHAGCVITTSGVFSFLFSSLGGMSCGSASIGGAGNKGTSCHAQSLAATNCVTEQLGWLAVESLFMSCSISWMASLIDNFIFWI